MDFPDFNSRAPCEIGDRPTSDVVVRLRTTEGRDDWVYCHSSILIERSKYFADRLSENWPTCQIIDSRNCVDLNCQESDVDHHVNVLRLFYVVMDGSTVDLWHGVKNALGILRVAVELGCPEIVSACVEYLEAVPWEESDEEEILRIIPGMGSPSEHILARLQPVNQTFIVKIFISAVQFAMSSPPQYMNDLKSSAQEQLEYMLTEDDDAPLLIADSEIKSEVAENVKKLLSEFNKLLDSILSETKETGLIGGEMELFISNLSDLLWTCQILSKLEMMRDFVLSWTEASEKILMVVKQAGLESQIECVETKLKLIEVADKVLESIGYGSVILPTSKRLHMVKVWLPFVRVTKHLIDSVTANSEDGVTFKFDGELWQSLESAFVSIILALPSEDQAEILTEWLSNEHVRYPDLTEAFEVWCYRSKVAKRRLAALKSIHDTRNPS